MTDAGIKFLEGRNLDPEMCMSLGITDNGKELVIPFKVNGKTVNEKYRTLRGKDWRQQKGGTQCLWNQDILHDESQQGKTIVVTEGELDALAAIQAGFGRVVAFPGGAPDPKNGRYGADAEKYKIFDVLLQLLRQPEEHKTNVVLAFDGDAAGKLLVEDVAELIGQYRCKHLNYPTGTKDLGDCLSKFGERGIEAVDKTLRKRSVWCSMAGEVALLTSFKKQVLGEAFSTGFGSLDRLFQWRAGDTYVVTGVPNDGKTTVTMALIAKAAMMHGWRVGVFSPEQDMALMADDLAEAIGRDMVERHFVGIAPAAYGDACDLYWFLDHADRAVRQYRCTIIILDPWNELEHTRRKDESMTEYVGRAIIELKRFAKHMGIILIIVAHPHKLKAGEEIGLYSISDSANWGNKPDVVMVVKRVENHTMIKTIKVRDQKRMGSRGETWFSLDINRLQLMPSSDPREMEKKYRGNKGQAKKTKAATGALFED